MYSTMKEDNVWRRRYNVKLYNLYTRSGNRDSNKIKIGKLWWIGHVAHKCISKASFWSYTNKQQGQSKTKTQREWRRLVQLTVWPEKNSEEARESRGPPVVL